ncbi:S49 family peptidase [Imhoffiella purpurea]|uniref:Peptidase S49 domain-containing protein n=1 Tax=Imhoffiella purpurea TaxID=1249627 RepID=W9VB14_9GAMM|nr:S49 family peptidase [Imhoffiella purpurea]EXJ13237.1 hypothetical protein D779_3915 [Imhoffiella purpurea]
MPASIPATAWAILPDQLEGVLALLERPEAELRALAPSSPMAGTSREGEAALIPIIGPILRRPSLVSRLLGWPDLDTLARQLAAANADSSVSRILLEIDSPGGVAQGPEALATLIHASAKPVTAYTDGLCCSAAYWIASAASEIQVSPTAMVGSVGIVSTHRRRAPDLIEIVSSQSPNKRLDPASDPGRAEAQRLVDELAAIFVGDVASYRQVERRHVLERFGRGSVRIGADAVAAGMADRVVSRHGNHSSSSTTRGQHAMSSTTTPTGTPATTSAAARHAAQVAAYESQGMSRAMAVLKTASNHPELIAALKQERQPSRPDTTATKAEYQNALDGILARGVSPSLAPLELARTNPELARRRAEAFRQEVAHG